MIKKGVKEVKTNKADEDDLLDAIITEIKCSTKKIYGCNPLGHPNKPLFEFNDSDSKVKLKQKFLDYLPVIKENLDRICYVSIDSAIIISNMLFELQMDKIAFKLLENIVAIAPDNLFALGNLFNFYFSKQDYKNALEVLLSIPPLFIKNCIREETDPTADTYRILNISEAITMPKSLKTLSDKYLASEEKREGYAAELRKLFAYPEFAKAQELIANGNYDDAYIVLAELATKNIDNHILFYLLGETAHNGKHYLIAEEYYKKAIQIRNDIAEYWFGLANCFFVQHKNEQAIKAIKTALTLDPKNVECWKLAGRMINVIESYGELDYIFDHLNLFLSPQAVLEFSRGLIDNKRYSFALDTLQMAVTKYPENQQLLEQLGLVYERMGNFDDAINIYEKLLALGRSPHKYLKKITSILSVLHDNKRLVEIIKTVSAYLSWDEATLWNKIGNLLMRAKDYLGASEAFRKVVVLQSENPKILFNLAMAYQELKLYKKAEEIYKKVLKINPNDHATLNNLGNVLKEQGKYDEAIGAYKKAIEIEPNKAISWANLGILYEELKLFNEAKECYRKAKEIALKNNDYKSAVKFEEWENSI